MSNIFCNNYSMNRKNYFFGLFKPLFFLLLCVCSSHAHAQYLIDPTGGTVVFDSTTTHTDEVVTGRPLGFAGNFFGSSVSTVDISTNGNLNFSGDANYLNVPLPDAFDTARISPLWTALTMNAGDGSSIIEQRQLGIYYSVTWNNLETYPSSSGRQSFQVAWFGAATTIQGFAFQPGDIAFSYQSVGASFLPNGNPGDPGNATVGLDAGDGTNFLALPGTTDGLIIDSSLLPINSNSFVLSRPDGQGSYATSIQQLNSSPVPESSTMVSFAIGIFVLMLIWRKTRSRPRPSM